MKNMKLKHKIISVILILSELFFILFSFYLQKELWFVGFFIPYIGLIILIIYSILMLIKIKTKLKYVYLIFPIILGILLYNNIGDKISLNIELNKAKNKYYKIVNENRIFNDVRNDNGLYAFKYFPGIIDNWIGIVFDNTGILDKGIEIINKNYFYEVREYENIKKLFGGDIIYIKKLEENWYLCTFT
jgi:hypothetical protein